MTKQPTSSPHPIQDVPYKLGEECDYWLKSGEYVQQQAVSDGWLDAQGKLTSVGLQAIVSEQELNKHRAEHIRSLMTKGGGTKDKSQISGIRLKTSHPPPSGKRVSPGFKTRKNTKADFLDEVKMYLAKVQGKFVHFSDKAEGCQLVIRIPNEKYGTTSQTFSGTISDIRRDLLDFIGGLEEK